MCAVYQVHYIRMVHLVEIKKMILWVLVKAIRTLGA